MFSASLSCQVNYTENEAAIFAVINFQLISSQRAVADNGEFLVCLLD